MKSINNMKLYATTTSERASKGQGGNNLLQIDLTAETDEGYEIIARIYFVNINNIAILKYQEIKDDVEIGIAKELKRVNLKGKSQKGENVICADRQCTLQEHKHSWQR